MESLDDKKLHEFLMLYKVSPPSAQLVDRTRHLMREEMAKAAPVTARKTSRAYIPVGVCLIMSICILYLFTVGTVLSFTLPSYLLGYLRFSIFVFSWVSACILTGFFMVYFLRQSKPMQCRVL
jgi:hypothetical protein